MDRYEDTAVEILETIKGDEKKDLDKDVQKKVIDILKNSFSVKDEEMGKGLMKDVRIFDPESGEEFDVPLFTTPMFVNLGIRTIQDDIFPNYGIDNKYIGYTEKGVFYKINDFTRFMRKARKNPLPIIIFFVAIYMLVALAMILFSRK